MDLGFKFSLGNKMIMNSISFSFTDGTRSGCNHFFDICSIFFDSVPESGFANSCRSREDKYCGFFHRGIISEIGNLQLSIVSSIFPSHRW